MTAREFVDTNVLVYAFDTTASAKRVVAAKLIDRLWQEHTGCVSIQVLQEFYVSSTKKLKLGSDFPRKRVEDLCRWRVHSPTPEDVLKAITLSTQSQLSFWDAMIIRSAMASQCSILWTEDLTDGQEFEPVTIRNPFV